MLPALARRAIETYSDPGALVVDPMCGMGTTLVEAVHLGRRAVGVELEARWARLARANLAHARSQGARGEALVITGDTRELPRLLGKRAADLLVTSPPYANAMLGDPGSGRGIDHARACEGRRVSAADRARAHETERTTRYGRARGNVARLPYGSVDLVLTSPPYVCEVGQLNKAAWGAGHDLCPTATRNYSRDRRNLGHARGESYLEAMGDIYAACAAVLRPGGFLVVVTKGMRGGGALRDLAGATVALCQSAGLVYWQHVIALLATVRDGELIARPSFWQRTQVRRALARGERTHLVCHEDVLVFRKPAPARRASAARRGRRAMEGSRARRLAA
jgi:DNA modification methylase